MASRRTTQRTRERPSSTFGHARRFHLPPSATTHDHKRNQRQSSARGSSSAASASFPPPSISRQEEALTQERFATQRYRHHTPRRPTSCNSTAFGRSAKMTTTQTHDRPTTPGPGAYDINASSSSTSVPATGVGFGSRAPKTVGRNGLCNRPVTAPAPHEDRGCAFLCPEKAHAWIYPRVRHVKMDDPIHVHFHKILERHLRRGTSPGPGAYFIGPPTTTTMVHPTSLRPPPPENNLSTKITTPSR
jgi:hypothetical protein